MPSNSPSLAWVGFAVLGLAIVGGMGGLYAHRQNQETTKEQLIVDLKAEIEATAQQTRALVDGFDGRTAPSQLKQAVRKHQLPLRPLSASRTIQVSSPPAAAAAEPPVPRPESDVTVVRSP